MRPCTASKTILCFSNVLKRWSSRKNCTGIWLFLYYQGRCFFFRKIWSYSLEGQFSANVLKRWFFQKYYTGIWYFCIIRKNDVSFLENVILFFRRKIKNHFSQRKQKHGNMKFSVYSVRIVFLFFYKLDITFC